MGKLVGVAVFLLALVGAWWALMGSMSKTDSFLISVAFGIPHESSIEMNALASQGMTQLEPPRTDPTTMKVLWKEWADEHFELRDDSGTPVRMAFRTNTERSIIPSAKMLGAPVGYLSATLTQGATYTFDYTPKLAESTVYQHTFTAPSGDQDLQRIAFKTP